MKKKEILKDYTNKLKQFKKYNKAYFEDDDPIISDAKYDKLKNELIDLEKNYKFIKNPTPASFSIGYKPSKKVRHRLLDKFLWEICDMHRHNSNQYPEEKPTIASALREVLDEGATHTFQN